MAKWAEPRTGDLLAALHRIERVADVIARDETLRRTCAWNAMRTDEIKELAQMAARMVQGALDNGK